MTCAQHSSEGMDLLPCLNLLHVEIDEKRACPKSLAEQGRAGATAGDRASVGGGWWSRGEEAKLGAHWHQYHYHVHMPEPNQRLQQTRCAGR